MAIKPIAKEFLPFVDELLSLGLLDPKMAHSGQAVENAMKIHTDLMRKPFYRNMVNEGRQSGFASNINRVDVERPIVDPESMLGKAIVNYRSDRSDLGLLDMLTGTPMSVDVQSGTKFTPTNIDQGRGWASMGKLEGLGTAQKAHRQAQDLAGVGYEPIANSIIMGDQSSRFSTPVSEAMISKIQSMDMPKGLLDEFDKEIRKVMPDWVGARSTDARSQLMGKDGFSMDGAGAERHRFLQVLEMPKFKKAGFPQPNTALPAIDNPEYANMDYGVSGVNMWLPDTGRSAELVSGLHNSYSHVMPAKEMVGQFETPISWNAMNPRAARELTPEMTKPKGNKPARPYTDMEKVNANMDRRIGNRGTIQLTDQEWLDSVSSAIQHNKGLIAKYGSIPAALAAGEVLADDGMRNDPIADLRASEAQFGMSPQERAIADLRASEDATWLTPNAVSDAYGRANEYWDAERKAAEESGATLGSWFMPSYENSQQKAMGDTSLSTGLFAALEKFDPIGYLGLIDAVRRRK